MSKIAIEDIREQLASHGWRLLSDTYKNLDGELVYECSEGHKVYGPWRLFRNKCECPTCKANALTQVETKVLPKGKDTKRILALDQATHTTGWAVFDNGELVSYGKFTTTTETEAARCHEVKMWLISMINNWQPDKVGLEGIQFQVTSNGQHTMGIPVFEALAHLQGVLIDVCFELGISYEICHVNTWRHYCGVRGTTRTDRKRSMQLLVKKWYDISVTDDESDAIGLGKYLAENYMKNIVVENWE